METLIGYLGLAVVLLALYLSIKNEKNEGQESDRMCYLIVTLVVIGSLLVVCAGLISIK